jgi:holo-[acyl-carrier protein] synthase
VAVIGVGIDLVELTEFAATIAKRATTLRRVFTKRELAACAKAVNRIEKLAARFAAKEAAFKAAGTGWGKGVEWHDAELVAKRGAAPVLIARGALRAHVKARGGTGFLVSFSHSGSYATAIVMLVGD